MSGAPEPIDFIESDDTDTGRFMDELMPAVVEIMHAQGASIHTVAAALFHLGCKTIALDPDAAEYRESRSDLPHLVARLLDGYRLDYAVETTPRAKAN